MARTKIEDLPVHEELSDKEAKGIFGGATTVTPTPTAPIEFGSGGGSYGGRGGAFGESGGATGSPYDPTDFGSGGSVGRSGGFIQIPGDTSVGDTSRVSSDGISSDGAGSGGTVQIKGS